ncbi:MAG: hypothetical protein OSB69_13590, partial [Alphaproteobacteria bacterium]|nr:hypothetical protein [Alphaproteobacteria bacterium]
MILDRGALSAIVRAPCNPMHYGRFGNALRATGDFQAAESAYRRGLLINPGAAPLLGALGNALADQGKIEAARREMVRAMECAPELELIYGALATLARRNGDLIGAVDAFRRGLVLLPMSAPLAIHHGNAASAREHHQYALTSFRWAWVLAPGLAVAANNIARAYSELLDPRQSEPWFRRAAVLAPDLHAPLKSVGNAEKFLAKAGSSHKWLKRAVVLAPGNAEAISDLLFGASCVPGMDAMQLRQLHDQYSGRFGPEAPMPVRATGTRLKVGFASPDFSAHPVGHFVAGLFENHDPNEMRIICLSDTPQPDLMTHRLRAAADGWEETRNLGHEAWLDLARSRDFT